VIFRRYGSSYQSVDVDFDAMAFNDIGFRRNRQEKIPVAGFDDVYALIETVEVRAEAEGPVQSETKQLLLARLQTNLVELSGRLPERGILVVENESGHDYPKTRQDTSNVIEEGENRLRFEYSLEPALRVSLYRPSESE